MRPTPRAGRSGAGVTLIEMLVTITIIALFAAISWQQLAPIGDQGRQAAARAQIGSFLTALQRFNLDEGRYPSNAEGLDAIRPYLDKDIPLDPWGNPYSYSYPGAHGAAPDIVCFGNDGKPGGEDAAADIVSWR
ncbi:MAG: type II secretion system protein GspG [Bryobacterales bacterium]|nr:type II secretion system protein GspG [Bryobacterales bacterium]